MERLDMSKIVGIGACVFDTLYHVPIYPRDDTKMRATGSRVAGGGPVATGLVAAQKLGRVEPVGAFRFAIAAVFAFFYLHHLTT